MIIFYHLIRGLGKTQGGKDAFKVCFRFFPAPEKPVRADPSPEAHGICQGSVEIENDGLIRIKETHD